MKEEIKNYLDRRFSRESLATHYVRTQAEKAHISPIHVSPHIGKFLYLLTKIQGAKRILEIGTLYGYSSLWLAEALPAEGYLLTIECNPHYVKKFRETLDYLKEKRIEVRQGHALEELATLVSKREEPFDLIFIDADKENTILYFDWVLKLSRTGTVIVIDNLIPNGEQIGLASNQEALQTYAFNDYLAQHPAVEIAALPTYTLTQYDACVCARVK